jgi:hypothetical protein
MAAVFKKLRRVKERDEFMILNGSDGCPSRPPKPLAGYENFRPLV